jgi:hypothetical protein
MARLLGSEDGIDELIERQDLHKEPETEAPEYFELEDPTSAADVGFEDAAQFEVGPGSLPRLRDLPSKARPRVLFWIDHQFEVHSLTRGTVGPYFQKAEAVVRAIAKHLRDVPVGRLEYEGDWVTVPVLQSLDRLADLITETIGDESKAEDVIYWIRKRTGMLRSFAFHLPNGDVVTPQNLLTPAVKKKAIGAGALRRLTSPTHPSGEVASIFGEDHATPGSVNLVGETLTEADWRNLIKTFNKAAREHQRRSHNGE